MLTRAQLLKLVGMDAERYKSLARREQLPFATGERDEEGGIGWRKFSPFEALLLMLTDDLARRQGIPIERASKIINSTAQDLWVHWAEITGGTIPIWVGYVWLGTSDTDGGFHVCGTLAAIEHRFSKGELGGDRFIPLTDLSRLVLANVSFTIRRLHALSIEHKIEIEPDFWTALLRGPAAAHVERED